jgi:hypothetical protein
MAFQQFVLPDPVVLRGRMREIQRQALRSQEVLDGDGDDNQPADDHSHLEGLMEIDEEQAMDEVMTNYFPDDEMTYEGESLHPRPGHPRERLWKEAQQHAEARIFEGARLSRLLAILQILNLQSRYKASNIMLDDVF